MFCILEDIMLENSFAAVFIFPPAKNVFLYVLKRFLAFDNSWTNLSICVSPNFNSADANFLNSDNFFGSNPLNKNSLPLITSVPVTNNSSILPTNLFNSGDPLLIFDSLAILRSVPSISLIISIPDTWPDAILFFTLCVDSKSSSDFKPWALRGATKYLSIHLSKSSLLAATSLVCFFITLPTFPPA